eukprot:11849.XXX_834072_834236_1 [CDS] Oithona nana genome sequencing.
MSFESSSTLSKSLLVSSLLTSSWLLSFCSFSKSSEVSLSVVVGVVSLDDDSKPF